MLEPEQVLQSAVAHHEANRFREAEQLYTSLLNSPTGHPQAFHLLGVLYAQTGRFEAGLPLMKEAIRLAPDRAEFHSNLAMMLTDHDRANEAIAVALEAIRLEPNFAEAYNNLGNAWHKLGDYDRAIGFYQRAIALNPCIPIFCFNIANAYRETGELSLAKGFFERYLQLDRNSAKGWNNYATLLMELGLFDPAEVSLKNAIAIDPSSVDAHQNYGHLWMERGDYEQALRAYEAVRLRDNSPNISLLYCKEHLCDWSGIDELNDQLIDAIASPNFATQNLSVSPFAFVTLGRETTPEFQLRVAQRWANRKFPTSQPYQKCGTQKSGREKLRIGYVSADFFEHATAYLISEMLESHSRSSFEIFGYSLGKVADSKMRQRIIAACDRFCDLHSLTDQEAATQIQSDRIDILVDLKGYTRGCRTSIIARRPAALQVAYLGFPGTMGANFIDYAIVDPWVVPADQQASYSEKLIQLPRCYQPNDSQFAISDERISRESIGLPRDAFVFGCLNHAYKITPALFAIWMRLLRQIPQSVLWLLESHPAVKRNLHREAAMQAIDPKRLVFALPTFAAKHLRRHEAIDLYLDTFPVTAHTAASDVLRMHVPMVTVAGKTFVSRVASSLLHHLGFDDWIASDLGEYERIALRLAQDKTELDCFRRKLKMAISASELFQGKPIAATIEKAFQKIWSIHLAGDLPRTIHPHELT